jgi:ATP-binding cassette ChvD family protein
LLIVRLLTADCALLLPTPAAGSDFPGGSKRRCTVAAALPQLYDARLRSAQTRPARPGGAHRQSAQSAISNPQSAISNQQSQISNQHSPISNPDSPMPQFIYTMKGLGKVHPPDARVLDDIWLSFYYGAKIGVLGLNGAGKSSLLKIMAGEDTSFIGEAFPAAGISIGFLHQEPRLDPAKTVLGNVEEGVAPLKALLERYDEVNAKLGEDLSPEEMDKVLDEQGKLQDRIEAANAWDLDSRLELAMDALRLPPPDADVTKLSGGERRRVALCRLLLQSPDLLLLDEPTNHLDAESVAWLERFLKDYAGTVVAVTHDRYFLDNVAGWILELDRGRGIPWEGNYSSWLEQKQNRLAQEEKAETRRQRTLERELEWIRMSPRARQAKGKARLNAYEDLLREDIAQKIETAEIYIAPGPRLGDIVVEARGLKKGYDDRLLIDGLDFTLPRGGIVGVIGPNGAGKTTLFRMITGQEQPDAGTLRIGETVQIGYVDQSREALDPNKTVWDEISGGQDEIELGKRKVASRAYVSWFNFKGAAQQRKVGTLSGGERNRVHLAKLLKKGSNLLLLDEPTNDLDVDTLRALEEALLNFAGCAVVISHDRWFLDRIATHMLAFEGDSQVVWFEGNYQDYEADRKRRLGNDADQPHRIKYRRLTR